MQVSQSGPARTHRRQRPPSCMIVTAYDRNCFPTVNRLQRKKNNDRRFVNSV